MKFDTLVDIFEHSTREFGPRPLFGEKRVGAWRWMTYGEFARRVDELRGGLAALGVQAGDKVGVISDNRSEWAIGAYACYGLGAIYVPMYQSQLVKDWQYILADSGAKLVFCATEAIAETIRGLKESLPSLAHVVRFDAPPEAPDGFLALLGRGAGAQVPTRHPRPEELATLIYTSGTTGRPKGVMLSHSNIARNVAAMHEVFPMSPDDRSLAFLPWAHSFGQTVELHGLYSMGASIAIAESIAKIVDNLAEVRPTLLFAVPRIFHRIYEGIHARMAKESGLKRRLFYRTLEVARRRRELAARGQKSAWLDWQHAILDRLVAAKIRARFGGRLKYAFSGGAAISHEVAQFIDDLGITVYEGYGLTETSPIATANWPGHRKMGSVGRPIPGTRIEIDTSVTGDPKQGEIVVHGHNVMLGYYGLPEENAKVFTPDGGLRTGDMGYLDEDGFLWITGRIKEQYKLENGKYVVPGPIEEALNLSPYIANSMVYGANRPYNVAILVPELDRVRAWATEHGITAASDEELLRRPEVEDLFRREIAERTADLKAYERPQRFLLTSEDFTVESGLLTPKLSLKRHAVVERYRDRIEALYRQG